MDKSKTACCHSALCAAMRSGAEDRNEVRKPLLYPAELRDRAIFVITVFATAHGVLHREHLSGSQFGPDDTILYAPVLQDAFDTLALEVEFTLETGITLEAALTLDVAFA